MNRLEDAMNRLEDAIHRLEDAIHRVSTRGGVINGKGFLGLQNKSACVSATSTTTRSNAGRASKIPRCRSRFFSLECASG
jgi:hypothetical protein